MLHGEGAQVGQDAMDQWLKELPNVTKNYDLKDIYNCDETSIFFKALPNKTLHGPNKQPQGNKISKDRFSLVVCANAAGEKGKLLVIGKSKKLHSFPKNNSDLSLYVTYKSNKCGLMTTEIFRLLECTEQQDETTELAYYGVFGQLFHHTHTSSYQTLS